MSKQSESGIEEGFDGAYVEMAMAFHLPLT